MPSPSDKALVPQSLDPLAVSSRGRRKGVSWRAILVAILLIPFSAYWAADEGVDIIFSLMVPPIAFAILLLIVNLFLRRYAPKVAFTEVELVVIYGMLQVATAISGEWVGNIQPLIPSYALFADPNNKFDTLILPNVPGWLFIKEAKLVEAYRQGGHSFRYFLSHLDPWVVPVLAWTGLVGTLCLLMLSINFLMREEWCYREKLTFPLIQLPLLLTQGGGSSPFWKMPQLWVAFFITFGVDILNGFAFLYPWVPRINWRFLGDLQRAFPNPPWNAIGWTPIAIFPYISAVGIFLPSDLLFSVIFFFFFRKAQQVVAASIGYPQGVFGGGWLVPSPPYFSEQTWGAFLGLFVMALWIARGYLKELWGKIWWGRGNSAGDVGVLRWATLGVIFSTLVLAGYAYAMRLSVPFMIFYFALYLMFSVALTRMRAELGPPIHEMAFMGPNQLIVDFAGTKQLSTHTVANLATTFHFFNRIHRTDPMPNMIEAIKLGDQSRVVLKYLFWSLLIAIFVGSISAHMVRIYQGYRWGFGGAGWDTASVVNELKNNPRSPNPVAMLAVAFGAGMVFFLNALRFRFPWLPLNPVGYALAMNFGIDYVWFGLLIAFLVKGFFQRYFGLKGYRKLHAFALGVMLGEYAAEMIWSPITIFTRIPTYSISINGRLGWQQ